MPERPKIYLGGSISGLLYADVQARQRLWTERLTGMGYEVVDPTADEVIDLDETGQAAMPRLKAGIPVTPEMTARMDLRQLAGCRCALFILDDNIVSRGCIAEIAFAYARDIPVFVLRSKGGVHDHGFINGLARVVTSHEKVLEEALAAYLISYQTLTRFYLAIRD